MSILEEEITVWDITRQVMNGSINFPVTRRSRVTGKFKLPWMTRRVISHTVISDLTGLALLKITNILLKYEKQILITIVKYYCSHLTDFSKNLSNDNSYKNYNVKVLDLHSTSECKSRTRTLSLTDFSKNLSNDNNCKVEVMDLHSRTRTL